LTVPEMELRVILLAAVDAARVVLDIAMLVVGFLMNGCAR
jgi:hypothetical protein